MAKEYVQFGVEWRKELKKHSISTLEDLFKIEKGVYKNKEQLIDKIRAVLIVKWFNKFHPVGSTVYWRSINSETVPFQKMTVQSEAYETNSSPVCFFKEKSGFCSVEPQFLER